jgi:hypothetical protein
MIEGQIVKGTSCPIIWGPKLHESQDRLKRAEMPVRPEVEHLVFTKSSKPRWKRKIQEIGD